jgi:hypothetical protein
LRRLLAVLALSLLAMPASAGPRSGDPSSLDRAAAGRLYDAGRDANKRGDFARARDLFEAAYRLDPNDVLRVSSANMRIKLGDYRGAATLCKAVIRGRSDDQRVIALARKKLSEIAPKLTHAWIRFPPAKGHVSQIIDKNNVRPGKIAHSASPGTHLVGWTPRAGVLETDIVRLEAGTTVDIEPLSPMRAATIELVPAIPTRMLLDLGRRVIAVPAGVHTIRTAARMTGDVTLTNASGEVGRKLMVLRPGHTVRWSWRERASK